MALTTALADNFLGMFFEMQLLENPLMMDWWRELGNGLAQCFVLLPMSERGAQGLAHIRCSRVCMEHMHAHLLRLGRQQT